MDGELNLLAILHTLWRGKWLIFLFVLIAVALAVYWLIKVAEPRFTAKSVISLQSRQEQVVDLDNVIPGLGGDRWTVNTEVEVLQARNLVEQLVETLKLEEDPEFNKHIRENSPSLVALAIREVRTLISGPPAPKPAPGPRRVRNDTIDAVLRSVNVRNVQLTFVFEIEVRTRNPEKSAQIADTLAELYIADQLNAKLDANKGATEWLTARVEQLEAELEVSENKVKTFAAQADLVSEDALALRRRQLKEFRDRRSDVRADKAALDARLIAIKEAQNGGNLAAIAAAANDPSLRVGMNQQAFAARLDRIVEQLRFEQNRGLAQLTALDASIAEFEQQVETQSLELLELEQLERVASANRLIYEYFLGRLKEISVQSGIQKADSRVLSYAVIPEKPSSPRSLVALLMAVFLGGVIGAVLVMLREMRNTTFRTAEELEQISGLSVLGEISRAPTSKRRRLLDYIVNRPNSAFSEAVRNLRTSMLMAALDENPQIIMLTSSQPGEGKTTQSLALTHSLASMNKKVLLIEGDIRRRTLKEYFKSETERGLLSAVKGDSPLEELVLHSDLLGADVLMGEASRSNAADFFTSDAFSTFIEKLRGTYDYVVIDTPPVLAVPDARVIAPAADIVLYVVHWDRTTQRQVRQGLKSFATVNVRVNGLVMSQIDHRRLKTYGYGDGYGSYGKGYYYN